jgi:ribosomal protein L2
MKEELETIISEAAPSETERAQKQIAQQKKLNRQKDLQKKRDEAKGKMMTKTKEMDTLMKARLADFKKKAADQQQKVMKNSYQPENDTIMENTALDALEVAMQVATSELTHGETQFAKIQFEDGSVQNLDNFSAKKIAATYASLSAENQQQFRYMLNKDAASYQSALDFAVRNI